MNYRELRKYMEEYKLLEFSSSVLTQIYYSRISATALVFTLFKFKILRNPWR